MTEPRIVATDWDKYYQRVPFTAHLTRRYTQAVLLKVMRKFVPPERNPPVIVEIGGANSCFLDAILRNVHPQTYHVIDSNEFGLSLLRKRLHGRSEVLLYRCDVLQPENYGFRADLVFSIGLIEHFDPAGTRRAIRTHFDLLEPGGHAVISFPTPTWLYRGARSLAEALGMWHFTDERPLDPEEVRDVVRELGEVVFEKTLWPLVFTQHLMVIRKSSGRPVACMQGRPL